MHEATESFSMRALELYVLKLLQKVPKSSGRPIRVPAFQLMVITLNGWMFQFERSPSTLWPHLLWDFLGYINTSVILSFVLAEQIAGLKGDCLRVSIGPLNEPPMSIRQLFASEDHRLACRRSRVRADADHSAAAVHYGAYRATEQT